MRRGTGLRPYLTSAAAGLLVIAVAACSPGAAREPVDTVGGLSFDNRLAIPPLAESHVGADGVRTFDLEAKRGEHEFVPGTTTPIIGYDGAYLGPTLRAARGERVRVNVHNALDETTTLHWHGMHLPAPRTPVFVYFSQIFSVRPRIHLACLAQRQASGELDEEYDFGNLCLLDLLGFTAKELCPGCRRCPRSVGAGPGNTLPSMAQ